MNLLARIFYRRRVKRLQAVSRAASLVAAGDTEEALRELERNKPIRYLDDVAVYHFMMGRVMLEKGDLTEADLHLSAARALGLERGSLLFFWGLVKGRKLQWVECLEALERAERSADKGLVEQIETVRGLVDDVLSGKARDDLLEQAEIFAKQSLELDLDQLETDEVIEKVEAYLSAQLKGQPLGEKKREGAAAVLGETWVRGTEGCWQFGMSSVDHRVAMRGKLHSPRKVIEEFLTGRRSSIPTKPE
jgi:hypothetical protein